MGGSVEVTSAVGVETTKLGRLASAFRSPPPKAAVRLLVEVLSLELGLRGITVNSLDPGPVDGAGIFTHMTDDQRTTFLKQAPMCRLSQPKDLVGAVEFMLSDGVLW